VTVPPLFTDEGPQFYDAAYRHNAPFATGGSYQTRLIPAQERRFRSWITDNKVPFDPDAKIADYDMRGFWKDTGGDWSGGHFPDTYKTPYDTSFSNESKYATKNNPFKWQGDSLIDTRDGSVVFGSKPKARKGFDQGGEVGADGQPAQRRLTTMLVTRLRAAGVPDDQIRGILAMNATEWNPANPAEGFLGLMDIQAATPQDKIDEFINQQWLPRTRGGVPGVGASGEVTDWDQYMTFIRVTMMGQTGAPRDWHGDAQPPAAEYQRRLMSSLGKTPSPAPPSKVPGTQSFTPVWTQAATAPPLSSPPPAAPSLTDHHAAGYAHAKVIAPQLKEYLANLALAHVVTQVGQQAKAAGLEGLMMPQ
jgi:hypothetical protein